jgi:peptidoglycan/xylan/chitin deacetylase (PgdA/CDA1 family)
MAHNTIFLPILMYHGIRSGGDAQLASNWSAPHTVEIQAFRAQLDIIAGNGYQTIGLADLDRTELDRKSLLITFDDGHDTDLLLAAPELKRRNLNAIFFVVWSYLGRPGYLSRRQVLELRDQGLEIGSHGLTHKKLSQMGPTEMWREVLESKTRLEDFTGGPIAGFAIPFGDYNDLVLQAAWAAGYQRIMTSDFGLANREHQVMHRMGVMADVTLHDFKALLTTTRISAVRRLALNALKKRMRGLRDYGQALLAACPRKSARK